MGCAAGQHGPAGNVTRAQMALFMQRLGAAVAPVNHDASCFMDGDDQAHPVNCVVSVGSAPTRRSVALTGACSLGGYDAAKTVGMRLVVSSNQGATWPNTGFTRAMSGNVAESRPVGNTTVHVAEPGLDDRYAVQIVHVSGSASEALPGDCGLRVQTADAFSTSAPFDEGRRLRDRGPGP